MSEVTDCRFVLAVQDLETSASFYRDVLGFEVSELGDPGWLVFSLGTCVIMAGECPDDLPAADTGSHSYFAYLHIDDIDGYFEQISRAGAPIVKPLKDEPWGMREFAIRTNDGHRIMFGRRLSG